LILIIENMHIIGCVLTLGAIIGLNSIIVMNSTCMEKTNCSISSNSSILTNSDISINIVFIVIGLICVILYLTFFICIECTFKNNFNSSRQIYPIVVTETN
jgi:hypothetical protein